MSTELHRPSRPLQALARVVAVIAVPLLLACHGDKAVGPAQSIAGIWSGSAAYGAVQFSATFTQSGDSVGGTGSFTSPLGSGPFVVAGSLSGSNVALRLTSTQLGATTYGGRFINSSTITGRLDAPDYSGLELTLQRQATVKVGDTP